MTATTDEWAIQVNIKHGPVDDRGNPTFMTNVRGFTARDIAEQLEGLAEYAHLIHQAVNKFVAVENAVAGGFSLEPVTQPAPATAASQPVTNTYVPPQQMHVGQRVPCPVNPGAYHERRKGRSKAGKDFDGVFCNNTPECAKVWL